MTQRSRALLKGAADVALANNATRRILAADVRDLIEDLADSALILSDFGNSEEIRLADVGVKADGLTDNATALIALRDQLLASPERHYRFICPPGELRSSDPRWLMGLQNFTVVGYGTTLVSTSSNTASAFKSPVFGSDIFQTNPFTFAGAWTCTGGMRFASASVGGYSVTLSPADAATLAVGNRVFLGGFDQQGDSYPPNWRYFEWKTVLTASAVTGVVTFADPLLNSYDGNWHDVPNILGAGKSGGKPRLFLIDRGPQTISYPKRAEFIGMTMGLSTTPDLGGIFRGAFVFQAEILRVQDVVAKGPVWPSQHRVAEFVDCEFDSAEPDKLCDVVKFVRPRFHGSVAGATGVNALTFEGGSAKGLIELAPRRLTMSDGFQFGSNDNNPSLQTYPLPSPVERMTLDGVRFAGGPSMTSVEHVAYLGWDRSFVVSAVSGTNILVPFAGYADAGWILVRALDYGMPLRKNDSSKSGVITGITYDEANSRFVISGTWAAPVATETWIYKNVREIVSKRPRALDGRTIYDAQTAAILTSDSVA